MALSAGSLLGPYEVVSTLGRGGMGEVWRARHRKLEREVAIKVLPDALASDRGRLDRLEREARLASALNHPNIVTIYDIAEQDGTVYIAMELVEGRTLRDVLREGPLPVDLALGYAIQIADGLAKAHAAGVIHRDLKPENLMVTPEGLVKILDFGVAKSLPLLEAESATATLRETTAAGALVGTPRYMSPEQFGNAPVDPRADQFSFGIVLYEMLAGKPPFDGPSLASIITAISHDAPPPLPVRQRDLPPDLAKLVARCLEKRASDRFPSFAEIVTHLRTIASRRAARARLVLDRRAVAASLAVLALVGALAAWMWRRGAEARWASREAPSEITRHIEGGNLFEAWSLTRRARAAAPDPKELDALLERFTMPLRIATDPPGATVSVKGYHTPDAPWQALGTTPVEVRLPYAIARIRIEKEGFETFEGAPFSGPTLGLLAQGLPLEPRGSRPPGTVRVPGGPAAVPIRRLPPEARHPVAPFWIDRLEVTNRQFKEFVDAGGYANRDLWTDGVDPEAFRDATGRPGPSGWSLATFPDGEENHPVGGVSWYEAAAYCRWAGKSLPTIHHWTAAIGQEQLSDILRLSNFGRKGAAAAGHHQGLGAFGTYDMAGNVREWCANAMSDGRRYILGGDWSDPPYMFGHLVARDPLERLPSNGIRCATYAEEPPPELFAAVDPVIPEPPAPVSDEAFAAYAALHDYDRTPLDARIESVDAGPPHWRKEVVSFRTAYDQERMGAILLLPRNAKPPYQAVVWYPGDDAAVFQTSETLASPWLFDFIPRSGRALVYPLYDGWYERKKERSFEPNAQRDLLTRRAKDLRRTIDYLETRRDIDATRIGYYGFSAGGINGPLIAALEPRLRASILLGGGIPAMQMRPEVHPATFAPRARTPTLMINGVDDFILPYERSQKPLYDLLGAEAKRHARLAGGHIPANPNEITREVLDWLDAHLGAVASRGG